MPYFHLDSTVQFKSAEFWKAAGVFCQTLSIFWNIFR